jgi:hypothetical protein
MKEGKMKKLVILSIFALLAVAPVLAQEAQQEQQEQETQQTEEKAQEVKVEETQPPQEEQVPPPVQETTPQAQDMQLGRVYFPRPFIHEGKNYAKGIYNLALTEKEGTPWFKVFDKKKELLFEEMSVVKPVERKNKHFTYRIGKEMLKGYEYFRVKVIKPEEEIIGYFFIQKEEEHSIPEEGSEETTPVEQKTDSSVRITH